MNNYSLLRNMSAPKRKAKKEKEKKSKHTSSFWPAQKTRDEKPSIEDFSRATFSPPSSIDFGRLRANLGSDTKPPPIEVQKPEEDEVEPESPPESPKPESIQVSANSILSVKRPIAQKFAADFSMYLPVLVESTMRAAAEATFCKCENAQANLRDVEALAENASRKTEELDRMSDAVLAQSQGALEQMRSIQGEMKGLQTCPRSLAVHIMVLILWTVMLGFRFVTFVKRTLARVIGGQPPESESN